MLALRSIPNLRAIPVATASKTGALAVGTLALSHAGVDVVSGGLPALIPTLEARFDLTGSGVAAMLATLSASSMLTQPLIGRLADRVGNRVVAAAGAALAAAVLSLAGTVGHVVALYALLVIGGLGSAGFHPAAAAAARRVLPERASIAVSVFSAGGMVGMAFGPIAVLTLVAQLGVGFTPLLMVPGVALAAVLWRVLPDEPTVPVVATADRARLVRGPVGRVAFAWMLVALASTTFHAGLPLWLAERGAASGAVLGLAFVVYEIAAAAGGMTAAWATGRIAPARLATVSLLAAPIPLFGVFASEPGGALFFAASAAAGLLLNASTPLLMVAAQERSAGAVAAASGLMGFASGIAGVSFVGIGAVIDGAGLATGLVVGFALLVPAAVIAGRALAHRPDATPTLDQVASGCGCGATN